MNAKHVLDEWKIKLDDARASRIIEAMEIQPDTGHKPGHKYSK